MVVVPVKEEVEEVWLVLLHENQRHLPFVGIFVDIFQKAVMIDHSPLKG